MPSGVQVLISRLPEDHELDKLNDSLEAVIVPFAGPTEAVKRLMRTRRAQGSRVTMHNGHFNAASTAELGIALMLAAVKRTGKNDADLKASCAAGEPWVVGWEHTGLDSPTLAGRNVLVLGYGKPRV